MLPMRRPPLRGRSSPSPLAAAAALMALFASLAASRPAAAQTAPAAATLTSPALPAPAAVPSALEAGDSAAVPGTPVQPLASSPAPSPTGTAVPQAAPSMVVAPILTAPAPPPRRARRVYKEKWFWGLVGAVVITGAIIAVVSLQSSDPTTPNTKLGDMRAF